MTQTNQSLLELKNVHVAYVNKEILTDLSLKIGRGEIVGLLGGNGSGKSTVLKTISGILRPRNGEVALNGLNIVNKSIQERQSLGIGYLLQGGRVFPHLTVAENFQIAQNYSKLVGQQKSSRIGMIFPILDGLVTRRAGLLSGGQRQMLAIEMVLSQNPTLALLDEPTSALSHDLAVDLLDSIAEFVQRTKCSALLVEQNVKEAMRISSRCLHLENGTIRD